MVLTSPSLWLHDFLLHCSSASHFVANFKLSLLIFTIKGDVSKRVVTQRYVNGSPVALPAEHPFSEHFAKQQSTIMVPGYIVIYLLIQLKDRKERSQRAVGTVSVHSILLKNTTHCVVVC